MQKSRWSNILGQQQENQESTKPGTDQEGPAAPEETMAPRRHDPKGHRAS